jgi:circadian clock protein KaiC
MSTMQPSESAAAPSAPTEIPGLDVVLGGGLPVGDMLFVVGEPGIGKTILALQMAFARVRSGENVLLLTTFSEGHDKLISHLAGFDFFDSTVIGQHLQLLIVAWRSNIHNA